MRKLSISISIIVALALISPTWVLAQQNDKGRLPQDGSFHLDVRGLTLFNMTGIGLERDQDPKDGVGIGIFQGGIGTSAGLGLKAGYLIQGHHDVGGHLYTSSNDVYTRFQPEDEKLDEVETRTESTEFRLAGYYNYNWHIRGWIMPYVGPVLGVDVSYDTFEDMDNDDSKVETIYVTPFIGAEGGVKLFPFEHVAFDLGIMASGGSTFRRTDYADDDKDSDDWKGGKGDVGMYAGVNIYF